MGGSEYELEAQQTGVGSENPFGFKVVIAL